MPGSVLIVDDQRGMCELIDADLRTRGFETRWYEAGAEALRALREDDFDVVLTDLKMPGLDGLQLCEQVVANRPDVPVVLMTAFGSLETAVAAMRAGAYDFITKPVEMDLLALTVQRAVDHRRLQDQVSRLTQRLRDTTRWGEMLGESRVMQDLYDQLSRVADSEASILITGESGTGKELVARSIHDSSRRAKKPFVAVNCAALPDALLESELFGHARGAFTDARSDRQGLFLEAEGGTLLLDEIGEMPPSMQVKLLRALEENRVRPVGANQEVPFNVRLLTATNRDLESAVEEARFRDDLFYRINVIQLDLPPLRSRGADVLLLAQHFVAKCAARADKQVAGIAEPAAEKLLAYSWPGNVRELRNVIERAVALTRYDRIAVEDLPEKIRDYRASQFLIDDSGADALLTMEEVERRYILHALDRLGGNKSNAARVLGLDRKTLYRKLKQYGVDGT